MQERRGAADDLELHFTIDWPSLEASLRVPSTKLLHWCNPHNPTGRCWTKEELERVASLCVEHDVTLCSDEVWGEVPLEPSAFPFTSMLSLLSDGDGRGGIEGLAERLIVLTSPSKCFNVAGVRHCSGHHPRPRPAPEVPLELAATRRRSLALVTPPRLPRSARARAAGESWRQRLVTYLRRIGTTPRGGCRRWASGAWCRRRSYLMWMDCADVLPEGANAEERFLEAGVDAHRRRSVWWSGGDECGSTFGCRRETLDEGLERMAAALRSA